MAEQKGTGCFWAVLFIVAIIILGIACSATNSGGGHGNGTVVIVDRDKPRTGKLKPGGVKARPAPKPAPKPAYRAPSRRR